MTHTITFSREEEAAVEAAARAVGRPTAEFLRGLVLQNLPPHDPAPPPQRDQAAVRRRMAQKWDEINADEDRAAADAEAGVLEEAAA